MPPVKSLASAGAQRQKKIIYLLSFFSFCIDIGFAIILGLDVFWHPSTMFPFVLLELPHLFFILFCRANDADKSIYANSKIYVFIVFILWAFSCFYLSI